MLGTQLAEGPSHMASAASVPNGKLQPSHPEPCHLSEVSPAQCHPEVLSRGHQVGDSQSETLGLTSSFLNNKILVLVFVATLMFTPV